MESKSIVCKGLGRLIDKSWEIPTEPPKEDVKNQTDDQSLLAQFQRIGSPLAFVSSSSLS